MCIYIYTLCIFIYVYVYIYIYIYICTNNVATMDTIVDLPLSTKHMVEDVEEAFAKTHSHMVTFAHHNFFLP